MKTEEPKWAQKTREFHNHHFDSTYRAIFDSLSHAAQHMTLEEVCTRERERNSQIPASG